MSAITNFELDGISKASSFVNILYVVTKHQNI